MTQQLDTADNLNQQLATAITQLQHIANHAHHWHSLAYDPPGRTYDTTHRGHNPDTPPLGRWTPDGTITAAADTPAAHRWTQALRHLATASTALSQPALTGIETHVCVSMTDNLHIALTHPELHDPTQRAAAITHINQAHQLLPDLTPNTPCTDPRHQHPNHTRPPNTHGLCTPCLNHERHLHNQPVWHPQWGCRTWTCHRPHHANGLCDTHYRRAIRYHPTGHRH